MSVKSALTATSAASVAADIIKFGGPTVAVLEAVENIPGVGVSGPAQGVIAAAVTILTAVLSVLKQSAVASAAADAKAAK